MHIGSITIPGSNQAELVDGQAQFITGNPTVIGFTFFAPGDPGLFASAFTNTTE